MDRFYVIIYFSNYVISLIKQVQKFLTRLMDLDVSYLGAIHLLRNKITDFVFSKKNNGILKRSIVVFFKKGPILCYVISERGKIFLGMI